MLPLHQSKELTASLKSYFAATFPFRDRPVGKAFHDFIDRELFKGPYLSVKLPFVKAATKKEIPLLIQDEYTPYNHQLLAFQRLTTREGHQPQATIMTTGTGSGKTESFLFPLLDYCQAHSERPGIKAIVMYPMNALATDQATRFAKAIYDNEAFGDRKPTVGLLIGAGKSDTDAKRPTSMGRTHVIEDRDTILKSPPDILLTNFKMLDYALMRSTYQQLWKYNLSDPDQLRFLVLDELHTYDGAQGSDVANLIRRLKLKFHFKRGHLVPVGTSATVGDGEDGKQQLSDYASRVFGEDFGEDAIIGELRESPADFFNGPPLALLPKRIELAELEFKSDDQFADYAHRQCKIWGVPDGASGHKIGRWLAGSPLLQQITASCVRAPKSSAELIVELRKTDERFAALTEDVQQALIFSLLSVADMAKDKDGNALFAIQVQLWIRELSGISREIREQPIFRWRQPGVTPAEQERLTLPIWHCRECGGSGWLGRKADTKTVFDREPKAVFDAYFSNDKNIWFLNTNTDENQPLPEYQATQTIIGHLDSLTLELLTKANERSVHVLACRKYTEHKSDHSCPLCNNPGNSITVVGGRATTIASIVTGQVLGTELDETDESKRKLLAFTNSVQDAAHQAGFIQSRNYRFSFRTALQTTIVRQRGQLISLDRLFEAFRNIWQGILTEKYPAEPDRAYVAQFFPAKKIGRVDPDDYLENNRYSNKFLEELDLAISWEATAEFGMSATVGRTLEKTLTAAVQPNAEKLNQVYAILKPWLNDNKMEEVSAERLLPFLTGLLLRQRQRGGVSHPFLEKHRTEKAKQWNLNYSKDSRHFLNPTYGDKARFPRPLVTGPLHERDSPLDTTYTQKSNWYHAWFVRCFQSGGEAFRLVADSAGAINEFYQQLLPVLTSVGLLDVRTGPEGDNYCLQPQALEVGAAAGAVECSKCNARQTLPASDSPLIRMPCTTYRCAGVYELSEDADGNPNESLNYYQAVYNRRRAPRIYATDHTGLLDRADRERKEQDFRERPRVDSLNALVATSTLEMGIDIGDLNVTMNTSVPPLPANFLQRVGRAGRKSGSALIINIAKSGSHDLFYYEEPTEMMAGKVHTPGCFLSASEILKRHFFAFVVDCWSALAPTTNHIPRNAGKLGLSLRQLTDPEWFPNVLRKFIKENGKDILSNFEEGYTEDNLDPETVAGLHHFLEDESLDRRVETCFSYLVNESEDLKGRGRFLKDELGSGKYGKTDPQYKRYEDEEKSLRAALKKLRDRQTLEHMTNFGLLPNYAFPETGVTMTAEITTRRRQPDGTTVFEPTMVEATRSAKSAIREMVPGAVFYTQNWQLPITGVNTADFEETTAAFLFCSNCDHLEPAAGMSPGPCPKCQDLSFASPENRHQLTQLREVKATAMRADATIRDNKEERDKHNQLLTRHFDFQDSDTMGAFALKDIPFGIEYVKRVGLREVNAGHQQHREAGRGVTIADVQVNGEGYITCRHCGKSTTHKRKERNRAQVKEAADYHYPYCRHREHLYVGQEDEVMQELFFTRTMTTEVLKLLLPVQQFERAEHIQMFMAGLNLGLKHYYGGNPGHLDMYGYPEFNQRTNRFDVYLNLTDNIPGGTGYLGKLFDRKVFTEVLTLAYEQIKNCGCQDRGKDGCYHCIFSYPTQHFHHGLSRRETEKVFKDILDKCRDWTSVPGGLGTVANTDSIEESELERRFVRLFRTLARESDSGWSFSEINQDGKYRYRLTFSNEHRSYVYDLLPQVKLGHGQGVNIPTRADFLLRLVGGKEGNSELTAENLAARTQVPCYLDGYAFHASRSRARFATDIGRRVAILESGRYISWTLSFPDVETAEKSFGLEVGKNAGSGWDELAGAYKNKVHGKVAAAIKNLPHKTDALAFGDFDHSFARLQYWMEHGLDRKKMEAQCHSMLAAFQQDHRTHNYLPEQVERITVGKATIAAFSPLPGPDRSAVAHLNGLPAFSGPGFKVVGFVDLFGPRLCYRMKVSPPEPRPFSGEEDGYDKQSWYYFWRLFNLLQLADNTPPVFDQVGEGIAAEMVLRTERTPLANKNGTTTETMPGSTSKSEGTPEVLEVYPSEYHQLIRKLLAAGYDPNALDGSFVLLNDRELVEAEAIIGSRDKKIVAGPLTARCATYFKKQGYVIFDPADLTPEQL
jgi:DEAD/DEAH box helicase domain-containing protein